MIGQGRWALAAAAAVAVLAAGSAAADIQDKAGVFAKSPEALHEAEAIFARLASSLDVHAYVITLPPLAEAKAVELKAMDVAGREAFWKKTVNSAFAKLPHGERAALRLISEHPGRVQFHFGKQMRVDENGYALLFQRMQNGPDVPPPYRINTVRWFIKNQQARCVNQRLRQANAL